MRVLANKKKRKTMADLNYAQCPNLGLLYYLKDSNHLGPWPLSWIGIDGSDFTLFLFHCHVPAIVS